MDAKVKQIPFKLRGKKWELNEIVHNVTKDERTHFSEYLEIQTKNKKEVKNVKPKTKT